MPARLAIVLAALLTLATALPVEARGADAGPFAEGSVRGSLQAGSGGAFGNRYLVVGAGLGYYVFDGLEVGLEVDVWFGQEPTITRLTPQTRYVLYFVPVLKPYVGAFYSHWFVGGGRDDADTAGGRVGAFWVSGGGSYFGGGVVHEVILSECTVDCSDTYPEISVSISF